MSYRESTNMLNRVRWQEPQEGTPSRTLANIVETEGSKIQQHLEKNTDEILKQHNFNQNGKNEDKNVSYGLSASNASISKEVVTEAIDEYNSEVKDENLKIDSNAVNDFHEDPSKTINVSPDDVLVKKQKKTGRSPDKTKKEKKEFTKNTVFHIEDNNDSYCLNGSNTIQVLRRLIAFLLFNNLLADYYLQFFIDGERSLYKTIIKLFSWLPHYRIILDWYHLKKKCKYELSLALKGKTIRNSILEDLLPILWLGKVDDSIEYVSNINPDNIKSNHNIERLIGYFERNKEHIPCYALRKKLGLRNSSNKGEKSNDLIVSDRQKENGMSWSKKGSVALATITALYLNNESKNWYHKEQLNFRLCA
jgi:hypothetical protein